MRNIFIKEHEGGNFLNDLAMEQEQGGIKKARSRYKGVEDERYKSPVS